MKNTFFNDLVVQRIVSLIKLRIIPKKGVSLVVTKPFVTVPLTLRQILAVCLTQEGFKSLAKNSKGSKLRKP